MEIRIFKKNSAAKEIDAASRVALFAENAIASSEIIPFGDVSRTFDCGITCRDGRFAMKPSFNSGYILVEQMGDGSSKAFGTTNSCINNFLAFSSNVSDVMGYCQMLSRKLHLDSRNPDEVNGFWIRCFCDQGQPIPSGVTALDFFHHGVFDCRLEVGSTGDGIVILEPKFFKNAYALGVKKLYFEPTCSRLFLNNNMQQTNKHVLVTSELATFWANQSDPVCWFHNCGDNLDRVDFSSLSPHKVSFMVMEFPDNSLRTRNSFAEALAFKTAALRQQIAVSVSLACLKSPTHYPWGDIVELECSVEPRKLSDDELIRRCHEYRLTIDPLLCGNPYEIKLNNCDTVGQKLLPFFFERGRLTLFQEPIGRASICMELLPFLDGKKTFSAHPKVVVPTVIFLREGSITRKVRAIQKSKSTGLKAYTDRPLLASGTNSSHEIEKILDENRPELVLLEISGYSTAEEDALLKAVDFCLSHGIAVGVFGTLDTVPTALQEIVDHKFVIGEEKTGIYIVKEKAQDGESRVRRFDFTSEAVFVMDSSEEELAKTV